jgi:4-hydroxy-2-oxoglutarate aldolase
VDLAGVFPPIATPFDDRGTVDADAIRANVPRWLDAGVRGIVALGSNGEAPLLDEREADAVVAAARDVIPRDRLLIAGTGRESTRGTITASRRAAELGADAVLVRTPSYFKSRMTPDAFVAHYTALAEAMSIPVLLYNYPAVTGLTLTADTVARLAQHPNIIGIKETSTDAPPASTPRCAWGLAARSWPRPASCRARAWRCSTPGPVARTAKRENCSGGSFPSPSR